jgi:hypothetical protein
MLTNSQFSHFTVFAQCRNDCAICGPLNSCDANNGGQRCNVETLCNGNSKWCWQHDASCANPTAVPTSPPNQCPGNQQNNCAIYECPNGCQIYDGSGDPTHAECRTFSRYAPCNTASASACGQVDYLNGSGAYCGVKPGTQCPNGIKSCSAPPATTTPTLTPTPTGMPACVGMDINNATPQLGDSVTFNCVKNASYAGSVTYDFRLIQKQDSQDVDPNPLPTPFVQGSTDPNAAYQFPTDQFGYYLFQCRVCAGAFCTTWQNPGDVVPTPTLAAP